MFYLFWCFIFYVRFIIKYVLFYFNKYEIYLKNSLLNLDSGANNFKTGYLQI